MYRKHNLERRLLQTVVVWGRVWAQTAADCGGLAF